MIACLYILSAFPYLSYHGGHSRLQGPQDSDTAVGIECRHDRYDHLQHPQGC